MPARHQSRRERDSNPRYLSVHTISNRAPSATRAPLQRSIFFEERVGVEPTLDLRPNLISNQALSATQPPLRVMSCSALRPAFAVTSRAPFGPRRDIYLPGTVRAVKSSN